MSTRGGGEPVGEPAGTSEELAPADAVQSATAWLARCEPAPPPALAARLAALLGGEACADGEAAVAQLVGGAERVVAGLLRDGCTARDSALDLLAADALATYAFELAGDRPDTLAAAADAAMARFAALGAAEGDAGGRAAGLPNATA